MCEIQVRSVENDLYWPLIGHAETLSILISPTRLSFDHH